MFSEFHADKYKVKSQIRFILLFIFFVLSGVNVLAAPGMTYHGQIIKPNGQALEGQFVGFRIRIMDGDTGSCVMYEETHTKDMRNSNGAFAISVGSGSVAGTFNVSGVSFFDRLFLNDRTYNFISPPACASVPYTPNIRDGRKLYVEFRESPTDAWEVMPIMDVAYVPFAYNSLVSNQVGEHTSGSLLRVETAGVPSAATALTPANFTELLALLNGSTTQYVKSVGGTAGQVTVSTTSGAATVGLADVATVTAGTYGSATQVPVFTVDAKGRVTSVTNTSITGAGGGITQLTGDVTASGTGSVSATIANDAITSVKIADGNVTGPKLAASAVGSAAIAEGAVTTGKIADSAVTSSKLNDGSVTSSKILNGTIVGDDLSATASLNISSVSATGNVGAETMSSRLLGLYEQSVNGTDYVGLKAPDNMTTGLVVFTLPSADGTPGQVLRTDGSGNMSWVTAGTGNGDFLAAGTVPMTGNLRLNGNWLSGDGGNEGVFVSSAGNVGIGINSTPAKLTVSAGALTQTAPVDAIRIIGPNSPLDATGAQDIRWSFDAAGSAAIRSHRDGSWGTFLQFLTNANGQGSDSPAVRMTIADSGNVGIGTNNPQRKFVVQSDSNSTNSALYNALTTGAHVIMSMRSDTTGAGAGAFEEMGALSTVVTDHNHATKSADLRLFNAVNGTVVENMRINGSGNVGIGTTTPAFKLDVNGAVNATALKVNGVDVATSGGAGGGLSSTTGLVFNTDSDNAGSDGSYSFRRNGTDLFTISNNGSINTANDLGGRINIGRQDNTSEGAEVAFAGAGTHDEWIQDVNANNMRFFTTSSNDNQVSFQNAGTGVMSMFVEGRLGIGVQPTEALQVGSITMHEGGDKVIGFGWSPSTNSAIINSYPSSIRWIPMTGGLSFDVDGILRTAASTAAPSPAMILTREGNLGLGVANPTLNTNGKILHIHDNGTGAAMTHYTNNTTGTAGGNGFIVGRWSDGAYGDGALIWNYEPTPMTFATNSSAQMTITASGNVGIGTTNPENTSGWDRVLDVYGATHSKVTSSSVSVNMSMNAHNTGFFSAPAGGMIGTTTNHPVSIYTNSDSKMTVQNNGNVGIGTTAPTAKLDVAGQIRPTMGTPTTDSAGNAVDFATGNTQMATFTSCPGGVLTVNLYSMHEGGSYSLILTTPNGCVVSFTGTNAAYGAGGGTAVTSFKFPGGVVYSSTADPSVYSFLRGNNIVFASQVVDFR